MSRDVLPSHFVVISKAPDLKRVIFNQDDVHLLKPGDNTAQSNTIYYGDHGIDLEFANRDTFHLVYYVTDAGWMGDVTFTVTRRPGSPAVHVRCVTGRRPALLRDSRVDFDGDIDPKQATAEKPFWVKGV